MRTIADMFTTVAKQNAGRTAVVDGGEEITYAALEERAASLAGALNDLGVRQGDRVALLLPNGLDFVASYFAIVTLGAIVVPLNNQYQQRELLYFLDACGVSALITSREFEPLCEQVLSLRQDPCELLYVEEGALSSEDEKEPRHHIQVEIDPLAPVMYQFSSGSTGRPKQIARTHANLLFELDSFAKTLRTSNEDRFIGVAPFSHVNGLMRSMMASVWAGATLHPLPQFERRAVAEVVEKHRITVFIAVPFMFSMLAKARFRRQPDFSSLRLCVSSSAPMPRKLNQQFFNRFGVYVRQLYGSTETGTISVNLSSNIEETLDSVGTPIAGVEVGVFTEQGEIAGVDELGEFAVKSPAAIKGYVGSDKLNKEVFRNGYFSTGDLGTRGEDGLLYLVGRKRFFINKGGYKINPHEIEEVLEGHFNVEEAIVIGLPTSYGDEKVKAVIVPRNPCTEVELIQHCKGKIADFKIPSLIEFRDSLPKSPTGKVRRQMLVE